MSDPSFVAKHFAGEYTHSGTHNTSLYFLTEYTLDIVHVRILNFRRVIFKSNPSTWFCDTASYVVYKRDKSPEESLLRTSPKILKPGNFPALPQPPAPP